MHDRPPAERIALYIISFHRSPSITSNTAMNALSRVSKLVLGDYPFSRSKVSVSWSNFTFPAKKLIPRSEKTYMTRTRRST